MTCIMADGPVDSQIWIGLAFICGRSRYKNSRFLKRARKLSIFLGEKTAEKLPWLPDNHSLNKGEKERKKERTNIR